ncbi:hypothetical protein LIER_04986 [Lithospermum erythrorhizon]|uniref:Uncharacterized protein n=1 Tax=Lithospermum erythrorhizon TaxID=34254 RepID=A0AAV3NYR5_LITER
MSISNLLVLCLTFSCKLLSPAWNAPAYSNFFLLGSFVVYTKKDMAGAVKINVPPSRMASPVGEASVSSSSFRSPVDSPHESIGGEQFAFQPHVHGKQQQWNGGQNDLTTSQSMEWRGSAGHSMHRSPQNGDYQHMPE